jgi:hypothetical protein
MKEFVNHHPWLTFFMGLAAINGVVTIVRGRDTTMGAALSKTIPPSGPAAGAAATMGLFGYDQGVQAHAANAAHSLYDWAR